MIIINMTKYDIRVKQGEGWLSFPREENYLTLIKKEEILFQENGIDYHEITFTLKGHLKDEEEGVFYIVTRPIKDALKDRKDLLLMGKKILKDNKLIGFKNFII